MKLIVKAVGNHCNIKCKGCFYFDNDQRTPTVMSNDILKQLLLVADARGENHHVSWHGGEPLLAGIDFYRSVIDIQNKKSSSTWKNSIQTNGILINKKWIEFFKENNFSVGISINGTQKFHDDIRVTSSGKGTYGSVINSLKMLQDAGIRVGVICTVTKPMIHYGKEIFNDMAGLGITSLSFNPMFNAIDDPLSIMGDDFSEFILDVYDEWINYTERKIRIREIYNVIHAAHDKKPPSCSFGNSCNKWLTINYNGDIYPSCERMTTRLSAIGNVKDIGDYTQVLCSPVISQLNEKIQIKPPKCLGCPIENVCMNGCTDHQVNSDFEKSYGGNYIYCEARKAIYERVTSQIVALKKPTTMSINH
ncbi:hypothetical protein LA59_17625 [Vibrio harveyi]|uniref:radical SAM/SPASM domain-containing protein n=1 Tax=Vibrio harveyi TaxID=669 RepID=UPI0005395E43|nr:radical SAM protein [Vibrio harveyi]AIV07279.1 hypothetical protein LA59_17625 [Vibrio harveyi]EGQ8003956.1 radical SAM protein [Vibrio parahaemolyticus]MBM4964853.1 radical SAM protein [Vibrio parahaemolyticus]